MALRDVGKRKVRKLCVLAAFSKILEEWSELIGSGGDSDEKPKERVKTENTNHINVKVGGQDGSAVRLKIKRHTLLSKRMKAYCEPQGLSMRQIRFRFDGQPINETDTPAQLDREDEDTIAVFQQQTGGVYERGTCFLTPESCCSRPRRHSQ
ncbi:small ubiquitin-related modifier 2-like [Phacochoerus africanus]|uniref:small ubiquitin-related modifier 2-like n=1 Tax=Phacochoerus africanus TaxID=41426 RepID=UPI001FD8B7FE|nr:small ubiquitin-related modifier 2-like [Phacochoerus africanus]